MPYLLPERIAQENNLILVLGFGQLSYLEVWTVLSNQIGKAVTSCEEVVELELLDGKKERLEGKLAGVNKFVVPVGKLREGSSAEIGKKLASFLEYLDERLNVSVSLYCVDPSKEDYEALVSTLLSIVREVGVKKANLVRPRDGWELHVREILSRKVLDFVAFPDREGSVNVGLTTNVPDLDEFGVRATERPAVSSEISLSPRLAKVLINLAGQAADRVLLDPFCGSGTILGEALLAGFDCIGVDRNRVRIEQSKRNLDWIRKSNSSKKLGSISLMLGDATNLQDILKDKQVDAVVTEPILLPKLDYTPSLEKAKRMIRNASRVYSDFLYSISRVVKRGGRVVVVVPAVRTYEGKEVSITLEGAEEVGLMELQPRDDVTFSYPVRISSEGTRWVRRMVYVFSRS